MILQQAGNDSKTLPNISDDINSIFRTLSDTSKMKSFFFSKPVQTYIKVVYLEPIQTHLKGYPFS